MKKVKTTPPSRKLLKVASLVASTALLSTAFAGGILKRGNGAEPASLDPHLTSGTWKENIVGDMFMGLTTDNADGKLIPGLAESWTVSPDGKTYTFKIRDAVWSDGTEITAHDFVYSFKRILSPKTAAKYSFMLYPIKGAESYNKGETSADTLGVKAVDKDTLVVTLAQATPYFLESLNHGTGRAVPKHAVEKHGKNWTRPENIVVAGAFKLASWIPNSKITLTKNPKFFDAKNVALDGVEFYPIEKATSELKRWEAGELHTTISIPGGMMKSLQSKYGSQVRISPRLGTYYYTVNIAKIKDASVREALSMSIDRSVITEKVVGTGVPAYSWVAPGTNNYPQAGVLRFKSMSQAERNAKAKEIMAKAGYTPSKPLEIDLSYNTSEGHKKIAVAISAMWKQIGVKTTLSNTEAKTHYAQLQRGEFEVGRAGWIGDYNDPYTFLELLKTGVNYNYGNYSSSAYDDALAKSISMAGDLNARAKILRQAEQIALDDTASIPIYYPVNKQLVKSNVKGWNDTLLGYHRSRFVSID